MKNHNQDVGQIGEGIAIQYLQKKGFEILHHHFTTHWGELDVIAKKEGIIHFIEVKTRTSEIKGKPYESVTYYKMKSLTRAILMYININKLYRYTFSFDIISIQMDHGNNVKNLKHFCNIYTKGMFI